MNAIQGFSTLNCHVSPTMRIPLAMVVIATWHEFDNHRRPTFPTHVHIKTMLRILTLGVFG